MFIKPLKNEKTDIQFTIMPKETKYYRAETMSFEGDIIGKHQIMGLTGSHLFSVGTRVVEVVIGQVGGHGG